MKIFKFKNNIKMDSHKKFERRKFIIRMLAIIGALIIFGTFAISLIFV